MLLTKIANAAELCWDSLDSQERRVLAWLALYLALTALLALQRRSRERLLQQLREELGVGIAEAR